MELNEQRERKIKEQISKDLETIQHLAARHMAAKGLGEKQREEERSNQAPVAATGVDGENDNEAEDNVVYEDVDVQVSAKPQEQSMVGQVRSSSPSTDEEVIVKATTTTTTIAAAQNEVVSANEDEKKKEEESVPANYTSLGETFKGLTERMKDVMSDMKDNEKALPFIDDDVDDDTEVGSRKEEKLETTGVGEGGELDAGDQLDRAIMEATGLDQEEKVAGFEIDNGDTVGLPVDGFSKTSTVVIEDRQGKTEIKREIADV